MYQLIAFAILLQLVNCCRNFESTVSSLNYTCLSANCSDISLLITIRSELIELNFTLADYEAREFHRTLYQLADCDSQIYRSANSDDHSVLIAICNRTISGHLLINGVINEIAYANGNYCLQPVSQLTNPVLPKFRTVPQPVSRRRYLELILINDHAIYTHFNGNLIAIENYNRKLISIVNTIYAKLDLTIVLRKVLIWSQVDLIVADNVTLALVQFTRFVDEHLRTIEQFDVSHLLTGLHHNSSTVGEAYKGTVCSKRGELIQLLIQLLI